MSQNIDGILEVMQARDWNDGDCAKTQSSFCLGAVFLLGGIPKIFCTKDWALLAKGVNVCVSGAWILPVLLVCSMLSPFPVALKKRCLRDFQIVFAVKKCAGFPVNAQNGIQRPRAKPKTSLSIARVSSCFSTASGLIPALCLWLHCCGCP